MDPVIYTENNRVSSVHAKHLFSEIARTSDWKDARLKLVMDIGCGTGNASTCWIDHFFPNIDKIVGLDYDSEMIDLANKQNKEKKIEYYVADIMDSESLKKWKGSVSRIFSIFVLHRVPDQKQAFRNILDLLEPSGEAYPYYIAKCPYYSACKDLLATPKWKPILEKRNQVFPLENYDAARYKQMFEEVGFRVLHCELRTLDFSFESDEECLNLILSLHVGSLSDEVKEEYKKDLFAQYMNYSSRDSEGRPVYKPTMLFAKLRKD